MSAPSHLWLHAIREHRKFRPADLEQRTQQLGGCIHPPLLIKLESGQLPLTALRPQQVHALCQVLRITTQEWNMHVGFPGLSAQEDDS